MYALSFVHSALKIISNFFSVTAEKEGYVMTGPDAHSNFNAHKLAEVIVEVVDTADGPLQVLI